MTLLRSLLKRDGQLRTNLKQLRTNLKQLRTKEERLYKEEHRLRRQGALTHTLPASPSAAHSCLSICCHTPLRPRFHLAEAAGASASALDVSPSAMSVTWPKYQFGKGPVLYACFRPPLLPPLALPAALIHPAFGRFIDNVAAPLASCREGYELESECALQLMTLMPGHYKYEAERQDNLLQVLERLLGTPVRESSPTRSSRSRTDGCVVLHIGGVDVIVFLVEVKNELMASGDPSFQGARTLQLSWESPLRAALRSRDACPALLLEAVGPLVRVCALAALSANRVLCEPLTPFLHCLPVTFQPRHLDALVAALRALRLGVAELTAHYTSAPVAAAAAAAAAPRDERLALPYPLRDGASFASVAHVCTGKLVYSATAVGHVADALPQHALKDACIKFAARGYAADVHATWAAAGLAPALYEHRVLPGGVHMVVMQLLRRDDGWRMLHEVPAGARAVAVRAAAAALARAHALRLPCGGRAAHGDCREANVLLRRGATPDSYDVCFIDFDWAGRVASPEEEAEQEQVDPSVRPAVAVYPPYMSTTVPWPSGARPGAPLLQEHDAALLATTTVASG
jgi:hypothetical protein